MKSNVPRVVELIKKEGTDWALSKSSCDGNIEVLRAVLESKVKCTPEALAEALWDASFNGKAACAELLLSHKADPNFVDRTFGKSTLGAAEYRSHAELVTLLKKAGAKLRPPKKK